MSCFIICCNYLVHLDKARSLLSNVTTAAATTRHWNSIRLGKNTEIGNQTLWGSTCFFLKPNSNMWPNLFLGLKSQAWKVGQFHALYLLNYFRYKHWSNMIGMQTLRKDQERFQRVLRRDGRDPWGYFMILWWKFELFVDSF